MKRILLLTLLFSCCTEIQPINQMIGKHTSDPMTEIKLGIDGLGITEHSFSNARQASDWVHIIAGIDAEVRIVNTDNGSRFDVVHPYNELNTFTQQLNFANYRIFVPQPFAPRQGLTFTADSDTVAVGAETNVIDMELGTAQCLVLIDSDQVCTDSIPRRTSGSPPFHEFSERLGFYYMYMLELEPDRLYRVEFCSANDGQKVFEIQGARRETIYFIDLAGNGANSIGFNFDTDSLFTETVIING